MGIRLPSFELLSHICARPRRLVHVQTTGAPCLLTRVLILYLCYSSAAPCIPDCDLNNLTLAELKPMAERSGVKQPGVGWDTCCPPDGNKAAIVRALVRKRQQQQPGEPRIIVPTIGSLHGSSGVSSGAAHLPANWLRETARSTIASAVRRAITMSQLHELGVLLQQGCREHVITDNYEGSRTYRERIVWGMINMHHICAHWIMKLTASAHCSYVEFISTGPQDPVW